MEKIILPAINNPLYSINSEDKPTFFSYLRWKNSSFFPNNIQGFINQERQEYINSLYGTINLEITGIEDKSVSFDLCSIIIQLEDYTKYPQYASWTIERLRQVNHWLIIGENDINRFWWVRNVKELGTNQLEIALEMDKWLTYWGTEELKFKVNGNLNTIRTHKNRVILSKINSSNPNYDKINYWFDWSENSFLWSQDKKVSSLGANLSQAMKLIQHELNDPSYNSFYHDNTMYLLYREYEFNNGSGTKDKRILTNYQMYAILSYPNDGNYTVSYDNEASHGTTPYGLVVVPLTRGDSDNAYSKWYDNPNLVNIIISPFPLIDPIYFIKASDWDTKYLGEKLTTTLFKDVKPLYCCRFSQISYNNEAKLYKENPLEKKYWDNFNVFEKQLYKDFKAIEFKNGISNVDPTDDFDPNREPKVWMEPHFNFKYNKGIRQPQKYYNELIHQLQSYIGTNATPNDIYRLGFQCLWGVNPTYSIYGYIPKGETTILQYNFYDKNFDAKFFYIYDGGFIYISNSNNLKNFLTNHSNAYKTGLEQNVNSIVGDPLKALGGFGASVAGGALAGSFIPGIGTAFGALGGAIAGIGGLIGGIFNTSHDVIAREQIEAQVKDLSNSPDSINNVTNKDIFSDIVFGITQFVNEDELISGGGVVTASYLNEKNKLFIAMYYNKYGYIINNQEILTSNDISHFSSNRLKFNFWEVHNFRNCIDFKNLNENILNYFDEIFKKGIRLWDSKLVIGDYSKENWEVLIAENEGWNPITRNLWISSRNEIDGLPLFVAEGDTFISSRNEIEITGTGIEPESSRNEIEITEV